MREATPRYSGLTRRMLLAGAAALAARPAAAQQTVDLQLVLAVDVSGSVNQARFELQRDGYVAAFRHPRVVAAVTSGPARAIAATMMQWTGPSMQVDAVPWSRIADARSADAFAAAIAEAPRQLFGGGTSISGAIDEGVERLKKCPFPGERRVIDISGDGSNNRGRSPDQARDDAVRLGIGINGLPIMSLEPWLDRHYQTSVIGGPGAFLIVAENYESFGGAILRKLIAEIAVAPAIRDTA